MPAAMTFTSLQSDLRAYLERGSVNDQTVYEMLPRLINLAERRIARELKVQGFQATVNGTLTLAMPIMQKPDRWRETISFTIGVNVTGQTNFNTRQALLPRSYEYLRAYWPDDNETGVPKFYADASYNHWLISPTPADEYPFEIVYYQQPSLLDTRNETNWITEQVPQLILYGALLECAPFLKDDERIPTWQAYYDRAAQAISGEDLSKILDRTAQRNTA